MEQALDIKVVEIRDEDDGGATLAMEVSEDLIEWFCQEHGLSEFSEEKFQQWFLEVLGAHIDERQQLVQS